MSLLDSIKNPQNRQQDGFSITDVIRARNASGTLHESVKFYQPREVISLRNPIRQELIRDEENFFERTAASAAALRNGTITFKDVLSEIPGEAKRQTKGVASFIAPGLTKFFETSGSIIGEGMAYAFDKNVREQYQAGNLDILPTITDTTIPKMAKYTIAAGIETAIFRSFPNVVKMKLPARFGVGALEGVGFAITEGMANDETPEEIIKKMPLYGVPGGVLGVISPYLLPLLKSELRYLPREFNVLIKNLNEQLRPTPPRVITPYSTTPDVVSIPISTPNSRYQAYLRSQGYEPYIPEEKMPVIEYGEPAPPRETGLPTVRPDEVPPRVYDANEEYSRSQGYEPYVPDDQLPVIRPGEATPKQSYVSDGALEYIPESQMTQRTATNRVTNRVGNASVRREVIPAEPAQKVEVRVISETAPETTPTTPRAEVTTTPANTQPTETGNVITTSRAVAPVGEGRVRASRLEQRVVQTFEDPNNPRPTEGQAGAEYRQMNKKEQLRMASEYVANNSDEDILDILAGKKDTPEGLTANALAIAMAKKAEMTANTRLAIRLASLRSTRAGQELSLLTEIDPMSVTSQIETIIRARKARAARKAKAPEGKESSTIAKEVTATEKEIEKVLSKSELKISEVEKLLNDILC